MTVIRRFDCILADTKDAVLAKYDEVKKLPMKDVLLRNVTGKAFYNTSKFTFERLLDDLDNIEANFRDYLNGGCGQKPGQIQGSERSKNMYSKEQQTKALRMYHRIRSVTETVHRLGYPS